MMSPRGPDIALERLYFSRTLVKPLFFSFTRPKSGSMLLYSRKKVRYRRDGYCWKKRKDGKTTREDHMKLKVQGMEVIGPFFLVRIPWAGSYTIEFC